MNPETSEKQSDVINRFDLGLEMAKWNVVVDLKELLATAAVSCVFRMFIGESLRVLVKYNLA